MSLSARTIGLIPSCAFCGNAIAEDEEALSFTVHEAGLNGASWRAHRNCLATSFSPFARVALKDALKVAASKDPVA
jgi:hypothetical protein